MKNNEQLFDKKTEDFLSDLTKKYAKGGKVVAEKTETINMKDFEGYADQYNNRKNKFFKANDNYQLLVNEGLEVKNNKSLPKDDKDKLLAELREKAREAKTNLSEERKDFVDMREVNSPFYAPQLADGGKIPKSVSKAIQNLEFGDYKFKVKHSFLPQKGVDVFLKIYQPRQEVEGLINFKIGVRNLPHFGAWQKKINDIFQYYGIDSDLYSAKVKNVGKSIEVQILIDKKILHFSPKISLEILKAFTNKEYYQSIVDGKKEETTTPTTTTPTTTTPPPTQQKGLPSTDPSVWGAEFKVGDKVKIRWDFSEDLGNGMSRRKYSSPENSFEIVRISNFSDGVRSENPTGNLYELNSGEAWEGKDLELIGATTPLPSAKKDEWNWRFKTEQELKDTLGGDLHAQKEGSIFTNSMKYLLGKKIKENNDSVDALFRINNRWGGENVNTEYVFGISNPERHSVWSISHWMLTNTPLGGQAVPPTQPKDKKTQREVLREINRWSLEKVKELKGSNIANALAHLVENILLNTTNVGTMNDLAQLINFSKESRELSKQIVKLTDDGLPLDGFVMKLFLEKYLALVEKIKQTIMIFVMDESDIDEELEKINNFLSYLAELDTFDKEYIINIK